MNITLPRAVAQAAIDDPVSLPKHVELMDAVRNALAQPQAEPAEQYVAQAPGPVVHVGGVTFPPVEAQPATQPPRKPLTDEQLRKMHHEDQFGLFCDYDEFEQIARAIEQAHGITGGQA